MKEAKTMKNKKIKMSTLEHDGLEKCTEIFRIFVVAVMLLILAKEIINYNTANPLFNLTMAATVINIYVFFAKDYILGMPIGGNTKLREKLQALIPKIYLGEIKQNYLEISYDGPAQSRYTTVFTESENYVYDGFILHTINPKTIVRIPLDKIFYKEEKKEKRTNFYVLMDFDNEYKYVAHIRFSYDQKFKIIENTYQLDHKYMNKKMFKRLCEECKIKGTPYQLEDEYMCQKHDEWLDKVYDIMPKGLSKRDNIEDN